MRNLLIISLLENRIRFLIRLYTAKNILASLLIYLIFSILLFQENQILGGVIILMFVHYSRKDILLLKIAYGEKYIAVLLFEYLLIFLIFIIVDFFINDPFFYYTPIFIITLWLIFYFIRPTTKLKDSSFAIFTSLISKKDFIWKSGVRKAELKFWIINLLAIPLMIGTRNVYIFSVFLFCAGLIIQNFYNHAIPDYFLDIISNSRKKTVYRLFIRNLLSFLKIMLFPMLIQISLFYDDKAVVYSIISFTICPILLFQFLITNIDAFSKKKSIELMQLKNGFSTVSILLPPIGIVNILYSLILYNNIIKNAENK